MDLCSPKIVGWAVAPHMRLELVCGAMQLQSRRGNLGQVSSLIRTGTGTVRTRGERIEACWGATECAEA